MKRGWKVLVGIALAALMVVGGLGVASAFAQTDSPPQPWPPRPFFTDEDGDGVCDMYDEMAGGFYGHMGGPFGGWMMGAPMSGGLVGVTAEVTGLSVDEVIAALQEGKSLAQIAEAAGVEPAEIVEAAIAPRAEALAQAVANGWITQEQADWMLGQMREHLRDRLEVPGSFGPGSFGGGRGYYGGWGHHGGFGFPSGGMMGRPFGGRAGGWGGRWGR